MPEFKPESLAWLDRLDVLRAQPSTTSREELKANLKLNNTHITNLQNIKACLDPSAEEKIRLAAKADPPFTLSYKGATALAGLKKKKVSNLTGSVHAALDVILSQRLATKHIKNLVVWIAGGKPASEFDPKYKPKSAPAETTDTSPENGDMPDENRVKAKSQSPSKSKKSKTSSDYPSWGAPSSSGTGTTKSHVSTGGLGISAASSSGTGATKSHVSTSGLGISETLFLDWLADISLIAQIKSKLKKHKPVSKGELALLALHKFFEVIGHLIKFGIKLIKGILKLAKFVWKLIVDILKEVGLYKYLKAALLIAVLVALGWFLWEAHEYGIRRPIGVIESLLFKKSEDTNGNNNEPLVQPSLAPQLVASAQVTSHKTQSHAASTQVYQPSIAWRSADEDQKILDTEIASLPVNCIVKDFPLTPDQGMPGDLAVSRLQDLTNPDKYTMKIGNGTQTILSVNPTNTTLTINYKSTDPFNSVLDGGSGRMNFFWEDVIMIHVDEIDIQGKNPRVIYQCSLIVSGAKNPLTIQCSTSADLKHLVSTMEYFIRSSRLAHDTALAGMPYPHQGMQLNDKNLVEVLWASSPANKSGLTLGDMVWSVEKNTPEPSDRNKLENQLSALTVGPHDLYIVSPADRNAGLVQMNANNTNVFNPKRQKVLLTAL